LKVLLASRERLLASDGPGFWWATKWDWREQTKRVPAPEVALFRRPVFMRQRRRVREMPDGVAVRVFCPRGLRRKSTAWVGRIGDIEEPRRLEGRTSSQRGRKERAFQNAVGRAVGWLWRWDGKSRSSGPSAVRWATRGADSGARTQPPAGSLFWCGYGQNGLSNGR